MKGNRKFWVFVIAITVFAAIVLINKVSDFFGLGAAISMLAGTFITGNALEHKYKTDALTKPKINGEA